MRRDEFVERGSADVPFVRKDPSDVLDYQVKWAAWLAAVAGGEPIASVTSTVPAGITPKHATNTTTTATIWLSGGTAGTTYRIACRIATAGGRTAEQSFDVVVANL